MTRVLIDDHSIPTIIQSVREVIIHDICKPARISTTCNMADEEAGYSPAREETAVGPTSLRGSFFKANSKQETKDLTWCNVNMTLVS
jgi:hypothetical protein